MKTLMTAAMPLALLLGLAACEGAQERGPATADEDRPAQDCDGAGDPLTNCE